MLKNDRQVLKIKLSHLLILKQGLLNKNLVLKLKTKSFVNLLMRQNINPMKIRLLFLVLALASLKGYAQSKLKIGSIVQENQITEFRNQKLVLIDFWATWCAPCIPAARQLEVYQEQLKDEVYMIGISDERESIIKRFVEQQDLRMAIYQDHKEFNLKKFEVPYRPYSVVLTSEGELVWSGSPSKLSVDKLRKFASRQGHSVYRLEDLFDVKGQEEVNRAYSDIDTLAIFAQAIPDSSYENILVNSGSRVYYEGDLIHLYSKLIGMPASNMETSSDFKLRFAAKANLWDHEKDSIIAYLNDRFQLKMERKVERVQAQELKVVDESLLWDTDQIDWGDHPINPYIIGEQRLEADNLSISEICNLLSDLKEQSFIYNGEDDRKYDWSFHYNYDNLMRDELQYEFGIELVPGGNIDIEIIEIKNSNSW